MLNLTLKNNENSNLSRYIHSYSFSYGVISKSSNEYLLRLPPNYFFQINFELEGNINYIKHKNIIKEIHSGIHIKNGLSGYIDIYRNEFINKNIKSFKVNLYPNVLYEVFNISPLEIKDSFEITINDIINKDDQNYLYEKIYNAKSIEPLIKNFEEIFFKYIKNKPNRKILDTNIFTLNPNYHIKEVSKKINISERWLQKNIKESIGLSLKKINMNRRFLNVINFLNRNILTRINYSEVALLFGYYDQSHLIKDFKYFMNITPKEYIEYLKNEFYKQELMNMHNAGSIKHSKFKI